MNLEKMALMKDPELRAQAIEIRAAVSNTIAAKVGDDLLIFGAYRRSLIAKLERYLGKGSEWDEDHVVFRGVEQSKDLGFILSDASVEMTKSAAEAFILPSVESRLVAKWAAEERAKGWVPPTIFLKDYSYKPHQLDSISVVAGWGSTLLGHDTGLGKTGIFLSGYLSIMQKELLNGVTDRGPLVIVTKVSLMPGAVKECSMWCPELTVHVVKGRKTSPIPLKTDIIIISMDVLAYRLEDILDTLPGGVVFDESHSYKNPDTKRSKAALKLAACVRENNSHPYIVCATATPMPNRTEEIWTQLVILDRTKPIIDHIKSRMKVPDRVTTTIKSKGKGYSRKINDKTLFDLYFCAAKATPFGWDNKGSSHENELNYLLYKSIMIRQLKSDVMVPMPMLTQNYIQCKLSEEQTNQYRELRDDYSRYVKSKVINNSSGMTSDEVDKLIAKKLNQVDLAELIMKMTDARVFVAKAKIPKTISWAHKFFSGDRLVTGNNSKRKKLVIFAYHKEIIEALISEPSFQKYGVTYLKSGMSSKKIAEAVNSFQDPDGPRLIICYSGAREGVTLTAASDILVTEIPFVPSWVIQMAGRCWARVSEDYEPHSAWIHYMVANDTIDMDLAKSFINKRKIIDQIMNIDEGDITKDDFSDVLSASVISGV